MSPSSRCFHGSIGGEMYSKLPKGVCVLNRHYSADSVMDSWGRLFTALTLSECFFRCGASFRGAGKMARLLFNQLRDGQLRPEKIIWRLLAEDVPKLDEEFDLAIAKLEGAAALLRDRGLDFSLARRGRGRGANSARKTDPRASAGRSLHTAWAGRESLSLASACGSIC